MVILPTHWFIPIQSIQNIFTYIITMILGDVESWFPQYHQHMIRQTWVSCFDTVSEGFPGGSDGKESTCNARDLGWIPGWGRSPGKRNGNPLQYSCLETSMDRGVWWATVQGLQRVRHDWATNTHTTTQRDEGKLRVYWALEVWFKASLSM